MSLFKFKVRNTSEYLAEKLGGKWKYNRREGQWDCDDGDRYVCSVVSMHDPEETPGRLCCYFAKTKQVPIWV